MMQLEPLNSLESTTDLPNSGGTSSFGLKQFAAGLLRYFWLVVLLPLLGLGVGWTMARKLPKLYAATAVLQLDAGRKILEVQGVNEVDLKNEMEVNNLVQTATSRPVLLRAIAKQRYHHLPALIGDAEPGSEKAEMAALNRLKPMVAAAVRKGTRFVDIKVTGNDADFVAELANAVAIATIEEMDANRGIVNQEANAFLMKEAERLRERLKASELALQSYKAENDAISLDEKKDLVLTTMKSIGDQYLEASAKRLQLETELEACRKGEISDDELLSIATVSSHPKVASTLMELSRLRGEMDVLEQRYKSKHPKHIALSRQIQSAEERLKSFLGDVVSLLESALDGIRSLESKLSAQLKEQEKAALELEKLAVNYNSLRREMETDSAVFESVLARLKEVDVASSQDRAVFRLYQSAEPPTLPVSPNIPSILSGSFTGGLALAVLLVAGLVKIDSKVRTVADAERIFQLPILGVIGDEEGSANLTKPEPAAKETRTEGAASRRRRSYYYQQGNAESFRTLRNLVSLLGSKEATRFILLSSAVPQEGKTFCTAKLAQSFAAQQTPTLVIDADLRKPALGRHFDCPPDAIGLTDVLLGNARLSQAARRVDEQGSLFYLPSGTRVPNPGELIGNEKQLLALIQELRASGFERVVFDSAPLLPVSDSLVLARHVDIVLMVVACNSTAKAATQHALRRLKEVNVKVSGLVLNRFRAHNLGGYYYSSYYYSSYYQSEDPVKVPA